MTFVFGVGFFLLFASLFTGLGSFLAYKGQIQQDQFEHVKGIVTKSEMVKSSRYRRSTSGPKHEVLIWKFDINYTYVVNGKKLIGKTVSWDFENVMSRSEKDKEPPEKLITMLSNYPVDSEVDVYYSKNKPESCYLVKSSTKTYIYLAAISGILLVFGLLAIL